MPIDRYLSYEHPANGYEPRAMTEAEYATNEGRQIIDESDAYVWQWANSREEAVSQHVKKHAAWERDVSAGSPERATY